MAHLITLDPVSGDHLKLCAQLFDFLRVIECWEDVVALIPEGLRFPFQDLGLRFSSMVCCLRVTWARKI